MAMLGGIDNGLFFQGFGGFFVMLVLIPILIWMSSSPTSREQAKKRREIKKSLRQVRRK